MSDGIVLRIGDRVLMRNKWGVLCEYRVTRSLDSEASTDDYADPPRLDPIKPNDKEPDDG